MKTVVFYELVEGSLELVQQHFPAHRARLDEWARRGLLLEVGTWAEPPIGAMAIFTSPEGAQEFMADDPFLNHGVARARARGWDTT